MWLSITNILTTDTMILYLLTLKDTYILTKDTRSTKMFSLMVVILLLSKNLIKINLYLRKYKTIAK